MRAYEVEVEEVEGAADGEDFGPDSLPLPDGAGEVAAGVEGVALLFDASGDFASGEVDGFAGSVALD